MVPTPVQAERGRPPVVPPQRVGSSMQRPSDQSRDCAPTPALMLLVLLLLLFWLLLLLLLQVSGCRLQVAASATGSLPRLEAFEEGLLEPHSNAVASQSTFLMDSEETRTPQPQVGLELQGVVGSAFGSQPSLEMSFEDRTQIVPESARHNAVGSQLRGQTSFETAKCPQQSTVLDPRCPWEIQSAHSVVAEDR